MNCRVCHSQSKEAFRAKVLSRHDVVFFRCDACGFIQSERPYWLKEAYEQAITLTDTGILQRNRSIANRLATVLYWGFNPRGRFVDCAGGYGIMTRMMRDYGFDFYWNDPYCENLFAKGFECPDLSEKNPVEAVTSFDVLEHLENPVEYVSGIFEQYHCKALICTIFLYKGGQAPPRDWWYYNFDEGQHIAFYQESTMNIIADRLGLQFTSVKGLHLFSREPVKKHWLIWLGASKLSCLLTDFYARKLGSKTFQDHFFLKKERENAGKLD